MNLNKKLVLVGIIIVFLVVVGCAAMVKAKTSNTNFQVVWSEIYDDATSSFNGGYRVLTKIDISQDNRECYVTRYLESVAMVCYDKNV